MELIKMGFYQIIARKNDKNGNPFRLIMVYIYEKDIPVLKYGYEARASSPFICIALKEQGYTEIESVNVTPGEYKKCKEKCPSIEQTY